MKKLIFIPFLALISSYSFSQSFTLKSALSYPFPSKLTASSLGNKIAWTANEQGKRNVYVAEAPEFKINKITSFDEDDGQEITSLSISGDGKWVIFVRGGEHSGKDSSVPVNPLSSPIAPKVEVMSVPFIGGKLNVLAEGDYASISPNSTEVIFSKPGQIMICPIGGSLKATILFYTKGMSSACAWSPDGKRLAFVSNRTDHSFIGIYTDQKTPIQWILPSFSKDGSPVWSPDGNSIAFVRRSAEGGAPDSATVKKHQSWSIWTANVSSGLGKQVWKAPETLQGNYPTTDGGANLMWANGKIVFASYEDGWPHLYAINADGSDKICLTPGDFSVENVNLSSDKKWLAFSANIGTDKDDLERRHIYKVSVDKANMMALSVGPGIEAYPVILGDLSGVVCLSSTAQMPLLPAKLNKNKTVKLIGEELLPVDFPTKHFVTPQHVSFNAPDGQKVYGQLFSPKKNNVKKPAIVYVHGGPSRQMLLGWSPMDYYSLDYALNQYLVSLGFTVLSVNYRLGTGYGYDFHKPEGAGAQGAAEYQDVKAAGEWLATQPNVDPNKIGIYGGSYGGYLTALALGQDSKLFVAGVDIHGVNNRFTTSNEGALDAKLLAKLAKESSPMTYLNTWTSPVLIIHGDDDRNVAFSQSVELAKRFEDKKFDFEYLAIPDDTHHWMKFSNGLKVSEATAEFLKRKLMNK